MKRNRLSVLGLLSMLMSLRAVLVASCPSAAHSTGLEAVELSPDAMTFAAAATDGTVFSWDVKSGKRTTLIDCFFATTIAFSPDSSRLALADTEGWARVLNLSDGSLVKSFRANVSADDGANINAIEKVVFSGDGSRLAAQDLNGIRVWSLDSGKEIVAIPAERRVQQIALSHNGALLGRGGHGRLTLWDVAKNQVIRSMALQGSDSVEKIVFGRDDLSLISAISNGEIVVWDTETGTRARTLHGKTGRLELPLIVTAAGSLLSAADDGTLRSWDLKTGRMNSSWVTAPGFVSWNGELLLRPSNQPGEVQLWRIGSRIKDTLSFAYKSPLCDESPSATKEAFTEKQLDALRNVGMGESTAADGTHLSFITYVAPDCNTVSVTHGEFTSAAGAEAELARRATKALRVVEQGPNKDFFGKTIGERAVLVLSETNGVPTMAAVIRTEANRYSEISSSSLRLALSFERRHKPRSD